MRIKLASVPVDDQDKALAFYTGKLGFVEEKNIPVGSAKWLTVVSPDGPAGTELLLEPMGFAPARTYQAALREAGIPWTAFAVDDVEREYERLLGLGVAFRQPPTPMGTTVVAVFDDTCGNWIQIYRE